MEQKTHSPKFLRQRKFLAVLPLLALPFMTFMFWALGGGKANRAEAQDTRKGLNMQLPGANLKDDKSLDKLGYYDLAASDSLKLQQQIKNDPYYRMQPDSGISGSLIDTSLLSDDYGPEADTYTHSAPNYTDPNEAKVYKKLAQLNRALDESANTAATSDNGEDFRTNQPPVNSDEIERLEQMMNAMNQGGAQDPEMQQIGGMMDKILDVQHPERVRERIRQNSELKKGQVFPVTLNQKTDPVSVLEGYGPASVADTAVPADSRPNGFFSMGGPVNYNDDQNTVEAVIAETQTLVNGSTIKMRLTNDIFINGVLIPKNNFVFGSVQLSGERLTIKIASIRYRNALFPVELSVYDMDGMNGIYIPGAIARDVAKESADRSIQDIGLSTLDPSLGAQAASAGIEAAKTLFGKKVKLIKVTVKAGYQVLLRDEKQRQNY